MKTIKFLCLSLLCAAGWTVHAQTTTNLAIRFTLETATGGVTNSANRTLRFDDGNKNDKLRIEGLNHAYASYVASTNTPVSFHEWWQQNYKALIQNYVDQKQAADNAVLLQKLTLLLTQQSDLLSNADFTKLNEVAAKAP